jgi:hypothetical protein
VRLSALLGRKQLDGASPRTVTGLLAKLVAFDQGPCGFNQSPRITRRHEEPSLTAAHRLTHGADIGCDAWEAERHGLTEGRRSTLGTRLGCQPEDIERMSEFGNTPARIADHEILTDFQAEVCRFLQ